MAAMFHSVRILLHSKIGSFSAAAHGYQTPYQYNQMMKLQPGNLNYVKYLALRFLL